MEPDGHPAISDEPILRNSPSRSLSKGLDALVAIEDSLFQRLSNHHKVDGHDTGSGEANIFIIQDLNFQSGFIQTQDISFHISKQVKVLYIFYIF